MTKPRAYYNERTGYWVISIIDCGGYKSAAHYEFSTALFLFKNSFRKR